MSGTAAEPTCHAAVPDPHSHSDHCGAIGILADKTFAGKLSGSTAIAMDGTVFPSWARPRCEGKPRSGNETQMGHLTSA